MPDAYATLTEQLQHALGRLAKVAERRSSGIVAVGASALSAKLAEERFNVVVVGEFKRGKTTFVNALLGADVLPTAVVPLTSIVTALVWGAEIRAEVAFQDGRVETVERHQLEGFITERGNPSNRLCVDRATVSYPSDYLRGGVLLVDTPGVGSVYGHNTDAAYAFVPEADAAIFLTSADQPVSANECTFLGDVSAEAARMFFVVNKSDHLSAKEMAESVAFTRRVVGEALAREVDIYPVSARMGLEAKRDGDREKLDASGLARFETDFRSFLLRERGAAIIESVAGSARKLIGDERNSLDVQEHAAGLSDAERTSATEQMEAVFAEARVSREDMSTLLRKEIGSVVRRVEDDLEELKARVAPGLEAEAERFVEEGADVRAAAQEVDDHVKRQLRRGIERWRGAEDRVVAERFRVAASRFVDQTNALVERTVSLCAGLLGIELSGLAVPASLPLETRFTYSFFEVPTILESVLPDMSGMLPRSWNANRAIKRMRERVPLMVDKHCGRLRWDFVQRLEGSRIALERQLDERLDASVESLRLGLRRAAEEQVRGRRALASTQAEAAEARAALDGLDETMLKLARRARELALTTEEDPVHA